MRDPAPVAAPPVAPDDLATAPHGSLLCATGLFNGGPWTQCDPGGGGNATSALVHPGCPGVVFLGSDNGGLFRGVQLGGHQGRWHFEPFHTGMESPNVVSLAMGESNPDEQFYALCPGVTRPANVEERRLLYRLRFDELPPRWVAIQTLGWTLLSQTPGVLPSAVKGFPAVSCIAVVSLDSSRHVVIAAGGYGVPIALSGPRAGRIAMPLPSTAAGTFDAPSIIAAVVGGPEDTKPSWVGGIWPPAASHLSSTHRSGIGSLWARRRDGSSSLIDVYYTLARAPVGAAAGAVADTHLVRCTLQVNAQQSKQSPSVVAMQFTELASYQTLAAQWTSRPAAGRAPAPTFELGQVACRAVSGEVEAFVSLIALEAPAPALPRVLRLPAKSGWKPDWDSTATLSAKKLESLAAIDVTKGYTGTSLPLVRTGARGGVLAATMAGAPSPGLWRLTAEGGEWERVTFPFLYTTPVSQRICFRTTKDLTAAQVGAWILGWHAWLEKQGLTPGQAQDPANGLYGPKVLLAIGYLQEVRFDGGTYPVPYPSAGMTVSALKNGKLLFFDNETGLQVTVNKGTTATPADLVVVASGNNGTASEWVSQGTGEVGPDGYRWSVVPFALGAVVEAFAAAQEAPDAYRLRINLYQGHSKGAANLRLRMRLVDYGALPGALPLGSPWTWPSETLLGLEPETNKNLCNAQTKHITTMAGESPNETLVRVDYSNSVVTMSVKSNFEHLESWDYRRRAQQIACDSALAYWQDPNGPAEPDRVFFMNHTSSTLYGSWSEPPVFHPLGSTRLIPESTVAADPTARAWRTQGIGTMWCRDVRFAPGHFASSGTVQRFLPRLFNCTDDGGLFVSDSDPTSAVPPILADVNWNVPSTLSQPGPDGGPPTADLSNAATFTATAHRFIYKAGKHAVEHFAAVTAYSPRAGGVKLSTDGGLRWTGLVLSGLPLGGIWAMVTTADLQPNFQKPTHQGVVYAAVLGHGVYALPPGEYVWQKVGRFVSAAGTVIDEQAGGALLELFELAVVGPRKAVLASVSIVGDYGPWMRQRVIAVESEVLETLDIRTSHSIAGLYRLDWVRANPPKPTWNPGIPVNAHTDTPWKPGTSAVAEWRQICGVDRGTNDPGADAAQYGYPQAWRHITSISGSSSPAVAVTTRYTYSAKNCPDFFYDGGVFVIDDITVAGKYPTVRLLFTHPAPEASAFDERGKRLFVGLRAYSRIEYGKSFDELLLLTIQIPLLTVTPLNPSNEPCATATKPGKDFSLPGVTFRNSDYFTSDSPPEMRWPVGVFEVLGWPTQVSANLDATKSPPHHGPDFFGKSTLPAAEALPYLKPLGGNVFALPPTYRRLLVQQGVLLLGTSGSGSYWRPLSEV